MSGDPVVLSGSAVVLRGESLALVLDAVLRIANAKHRSGLPIGRYRDLAAALVAARGHESGHADMVSGPVFHAGEEPRIPLAEAAAALGKSTRQTRRLAPKLGGRLIGNRWYVSETALREHIEGKSHRG